MNSEGPSNPRVTIIVTKQLNQLREKAPNGVKVIINDADTFDIQADINGPIQTPYEGGVFRCKLILPQDFPKTPPKGYFITKIFHPNVSEKGEICVNTLKKDWNHQTWSFYNIFEVIKCLLIIPFPESALNEEAGKQFMEDYDSYFKYAKLMTDVHAKQKPINKIETEKQKEQEVSKKEQDKSSNSANSQINTEKQQQQPSNSPKSLNSQTFQFQPQTKQNVYGQSTATINLQQAQQSISQQSITTQFNLTQANQFNPIISNIQIYSPYKDNNKPQLMNNNQFLNGNSYQKNQNQENLLQQTFQNGNNSGILSTQEEQPLGTLSKNNGYYSNSIPNQGITNNQTKQLQMQQQQQFNKNNFLLNLTFNNYAVETQSYVSSNINTNSNNGKQQNDKKKWLKRI